MQIGIAWIYLPPPCRCTVYTETFYLPQRNVHRDKIWLDVLKLISNGCAEDWGSYSHSNTGHPPTFSGQLFHSGSDYSIDRRNTTDQILISSIELYQTWLYWCIIRIRSRISNSCYFETLFLEFWIKELLFYSENFAISKKKRSF